MVIYVIQMVKKMGFVGYQNIEKDTTVLVTFPDLSHDSRTNDEGFPHVPDPEEETKVPVPQADARLSGEHDRVGSLLRPRQLSEHPPHHERLQDDARDALKTHDQHSLWTLLGGVSEEENVELP